MTKKIFVFILAVLLYAVSVLAEGEPQPAGIPKVVYYQALNFFGLLAILYYLMRKKVGAFFVQRHDILSAALIEAKRVREEAEKKHQEYTVKIQNLDQEATHILDQIKKDGIELKNRMIAEAKILVENIENEAKKTAQNEIERAKTELYDEVLMQALDGARNILVKSIVENDQKRLQKEFVEKIEAVQ